MPKMIVSIDGVIIKEVQLTKERTTLGRRPYNDVVIDNLAVSGEHAAFQITGHDVVLEDLGSTNGTYVNGKAIKQQPLQHGDQIEVGKYKIEFVGDIANSAVAAVAPPVKANEEPASAPAAHPVFAATSTHDLGGDPARAASVKVLSGAAAGREVPLTKVVTTIGKPGVAVAAITKRPHGFVVHHVEGAGNPSLNGNPIGADPVPLQDGDVIALAGTQMQFVQP